MNIMKKTLSVLAVAFLGGVIALSGYVYFTEPFENNFTSDELVQQTNFIPTNLSLTNNSLSEELPNFVSAAEKTIDAVVHVKNTAIVSGPVSISDLFFGRQPQRAQVGTGSGVIISPDGYIVTNNHVIDGAKEISITTNDNRILPATLIGTDPKTDIALLKVEINQDLPYITFGNSDDAKVGEWVLAIGNPLNLTSTVTAGIISAKSRDLTGRYDQAFIQTDAAVNPGNSGGALVNTNGELIGINTAITSRTGSYIGYSFAVPSNITRKVVNDILEYGSVQTGILGVIGGSLNSEVAEKFKTKETEGFYITEVESKSGAALAGLKEGDIIKQIDHIKISKFTDMNGYLKSKQPNDVVQIKYLRDHKLNEVNVTLAKRTSTNFVIVGVLKEPTIEELKKLKIDHGLKIERLTDNERLREAWVQNGIKEGTIVTKINNQKIYTIDDVERIKSEITLNRAVTVEILNKNGEKEKYYFQN